MNLQRVQAFLESQVETSLFLLSNLTKLGSRITSHLNSGNFKLIEENDRICGVFCLTQRGILLAQTDGCTDLAETIIRACETEPSAINGIVGEWTIAEAIWKKLLANPKFHKTHASKEILFRLEPTRVPAPALELPEVKTLVANDLDRWLELNTDYLTEEGLPVQGTVLERQTQFIAQCRAGYWWGAFDRGQLVSTAALNATYKTLCQVGGVYTVPKKRREGYARKTMELLIHDSIIRHQFTKIILFTGEHNLAARKLYESLGFTHVGHFGLLFGSWEAQ